MQERSKTCHNITKTRLFKYIENFTPKNRIPAIHKWHCPWNSIEYPTFADDTSLYIIVENPDAAAEILNTDLNKISKWAKSWLVKFKPNKNESLIISRKINKPGHPPVFMSNQEINEVQFHKHLGIYISSDCSWHKHIENVKSKAWSRINVMRKFKYTWDRKSLETIYTAFIRPIL